MIDGRELGFGRVLFVLLRTAGALRRMLGLGVRDERSEGAGLLEDEALHPIVVEQDGLAALGRDRDGLAGSDHGQADQEGRTGLAHAVAEGQALDGVGGDGVGAVLALDVRRPLRVDLKGDAQVVLVRLLAHGEEEGVLAGLLAPLHVPHLGEVHAVDEVDGRPVLALDRDDLGGLPIVRADVDELAGRVAEAHGVPLGRTIRGGLLRRGLEGPEPVSEHRDGLPTDELEVNPHCFHTAPLRRMARKLGTERALPARRSPLNE